MSEDLNGRILQKENHLFKPRLEDRLTDETFVMKKILSTNANSV